MLSYRLPDRLIEINNIVLDYNGTIATDGQLLARVQELLIELGKQANLYVLTADTYGTAKSACHGLPVEFAVVNRDNGGPDKAALVERLGSGVTAAIGNGRNDVLMLKKAVLSLLVLGEEGAAVEALAAADVVFRSAVDALVFLLKPERVIATLRP